MKIHPKIHPVALAAFLAAAGANAQTNDTPQVEIIGLTPAPGTGVAKDRIPANVQTATERKLRDQQSLNIAEFLAGNLASVNVNEIQGNPYQLELNFRGFSASPLLGTPQGLSVFFDGVRVNEPFGDVVNWDLLPTSAVAGLTLNPGSNPLFGLNTLGGALVLQTKNGLTHPGTEAEVQVGSFGRRSLELSHGRALGDDGAHLFLAAATFDEDGWRDHSPSEVRQLFGKVGQEHERYGWSASLTHADNSLVGNGLLPESMAAADRKQIYTRPDQTDNRMTMLALNGRWQADANWEITGTAYYRDGRASTLNGDLNDDYDPPEIEETGVENRTKTSQRAAGIAVQAARSVGAHRLMFGASYDSSRSDFEQTEAEGMLDDTRAVVDAEETEVNAKIHGTSRTASVYASDLWTLRPDLQLTLAARFNQTTVETDDVGARELGLDTNLDARDTYRKLNPAIGLTWQLSPAATVYGGWSQGNRTPTPVELGCSDPEQACVLPNALQSDPPLKQVVSRTLEAGVRGRFDNGLRWNASAFRSVNHDDLLFISNGRAAGYFTNVGRTQRQGIELELASPRGGQLDWAVAYSFLDAVFDAGACLVAEANSSAETSAACPGEGEIEVRKGDRLPSLPRHSLKVSADWRPLADWRFGAQFAAYSSQYVRGNENNAHRPDGDEFNGAGRIGGYALVNLTSSWRFARGWELIAKVSNLFDREYATAGALGENAFAPNGGLLAPDDWRQEQFVGPGAPRAAWIGLRMEL